MSVALISLTYKCRGHSKEYIDNLSKHLHNSFDFSLYYYNQKLNRNGLGVLDYKTEQIGAPYRKILRRFFYSLRFYFSNRKSIRDNKLLYFTDYEYLSLLLSIVLFFRKNKKIVWIHSASCDGNFFYKSYKKLFFYLLSKLQIDGCVVNGTETKNELVKLISSKIPVHVIQYPSELNVLPMNSIDAKKQLGFQNKKVFSLIGMIRKDKNYEYAISAFAQSNAFNNPDSVLHIAGAPSGISESSVLKWLRQHSVKNYKLDSGYLSEEEINTAFSASDCLLMPYGNTGSSQSGPLSLCRNYGLPAIVRGGGEIGRYVEYEEVGFSCNNLKEFITAMNMIHSCKLLTKFADAILKAKRKFSWSQAAIKYKEVFNGVK